MVSNDHDSAANPELSGAGSSLSLGKVSLLAVIYAQNRLVHWHEGQPEPALPFDEEIPASRVLEEAELQSVYVPLMLKAADVPRGLSFNIAEPTLQSWYQAQGADVSGMVQYLFSDGLILSATQLLRHAHSVEVPRMLWPILPNIAAELRGESAYFLHSRKEEGYRSKWALESEQTLLSILLNASRLRHRHDFKILFTQNEDATSPRRATEVHKIRLAPEAAGDWAVTTSPDLHRLGETGHAHVQLTFSESANPVLRTRHLFFEIPSREIAFHTQWSQYERVRGLLRSLGASGPNAGLSEAPDDDGFDLNGHVRMQGALIEIKQFLQTNGARSLTIRPGTQSVACENVVPRLWIKADGSLRLSTHIRTPTGGYEAVGLPPSSLYIAMTLLGGLGASTGLANAQIAYKRRGIKRDRDLRILKHLGFAALIFFEASSYALGQPLSDGTQPKSLPDLLQSLYKRLGSLLLKAEGWPIQVGSLDELCSRNITSLIEGFIRQILRDCDHEEGHTKQAHVLDEESTVNLYLPDGEVKLEGYSRQMAALFHALVLDLAHKTSGGIFERARSKYFEEFLRSLLERKDEDDSQVPEPMELLCFRAINPNPQVKAFAALDRGPVFILPESSRPPHGQALFSLAEYGCLVFYEGQLIEAFDLADFKPEFRLDEEPSVIANDTRNINWFELHPKFFFKGVEITPEQASQLSREGVLEFQGKIYRLKSRDLPSLARLQEFWEGIQGDKGVVSSGKKRRTTADTYYQLPKSKTLELLALRATGVKISGGPRWQKICDFYDSLDQHREPPTVPSSFCAVLKGYQQTGVGWLRDLYEMGLGGILADDMGLGKTVTTLAFMEILRVEKRLGPSLIIVPTSLTYNWFSEIERFSPGLQTRLFHSRAQEETLNFIQATPDCAVITTYGLLQENLGWFAQTQWNMIVFDEAQNLKNISAKRTTSARQLNGSFKVCLTGTPLENHYGEFYSLFDLVMPGGLGDLAKFREKYVNPSALLRDEIRFLRLKTKPLVLRRTKGQVMQELPPKVETTVKLPFEAEQKRIYRDIAASYNEQVQKAIRVQGESKTQLQMLTALLRLRQACSDPSGIPNVRYTHEPPKLSVLLGALEGILESGESALVFTQFIATFERIKLTLETARIKHFTINGADARAVREQRLRAFKEEPAGAVMLMTLKTGGVGLNLTKASYVFHIEPWWNPAVESQATDRAHRIGQEKTVQIYRYIIKESVEEKIEQLKAIKGERFDALFNESEREAEVTDRFTESGRVETTRGSSRLSQSDFEYLLS